VLLSQAIYGMERTKGIQEGQIPEEEKERD
jgi:hypothetical protein